MLVPSRVCALSLNYADLQDQGEQEKLFMTAQRGKKALQVVGEHQDFMTKGRKAEIMVATE